MVNVDNLIVLGILHELTEDLQEGAVPFSQVSRGKCYNKLIYDDSKPAEAGGHTAYPVVLDARLNGEQSEILSYYDSALKGLTVRYCVYERSPSSNYIDLSVKDHAGVTATFIVEKDRCYDQEKGDFYEKAHFYYLWPSRDESAPTSAVGALKARFLVLLRSFRAMLHQ